MQRASHGLSCWVDPHALPRRQEEEVPQEEGDARGEQNLDRRTLPGCGTRSDQAAALTRPHAVNFLAAAPYGIFAFSGESAEEVSVISLKAFDEGIGHDVRRRIAAVDSDLYTRIGAPIRHLSAALCRERTPRRLLLILSDGKPNGVDLYEGPYGVEDTRQAVAEARGQGWPCSA